MGPKPRVLYLLGQYPQLSETYIETELRAVWKDFDIQIVSLARVGGRTTASRDHRPFQVLDSLEDILRFAREFRPRVLHGHWLVHLETVALVAERLDVPFTFRAHSFDTLPGVDRREGVRRWFSRCQEILRRVGGQDRLLGLLAFPFSRRLLESCGMPPHKVIDCFPCLDYSRFLDTGPNGDGIMNTGACIPKKRMGDFLRLACESPGRAYTIYPVSYQVERIARMNQELGSPVRISDPVEPVDMPGVYKAHQWLVYTACPVQNSVGWPISIAEAQASGTGVIMADLRPDLEEYLGGAGFLYRSLDQVKRWISQPVPDEVRQLGFKQAQKSDVRQHIHRLTDLWNSV